MDRNTSIFPFIIHFSLVFRFEKIFSYPILNNYSYNEEGIDWDLVRFFDNYLVLWTFLKKDLEHTNLITVSYLRNTYIINFMLLENPLIFLFYGFCILFLTWQRMNHLFTLKLIKYIWDERNIINGLMINKLKFRIYKLANYHDKKKDWKCI